MKRAVVVGGGFIGLEMVENLVHMGIHVTLVEMLPQVNQGVGRGGVHLPPQGYSRGRARALHASALATSFDPNQSLTHPALPKSRLPRRRCCSCSPCKPLRLSPVPSMRR